MTLEELLDEELSLRSFEPIKDLYLPKHWVVYVKRDPLDEFAIYVGENYIRRFTLSGLPDQVKEKLVLIHSVENSFLNDDGVPPDVLADVGWQLIAKKWYQFVVSDDLLNELKGSVLTNTLSPPA
jgi:hypothetical protein